MLYFINMLIIYNTTYINFFNKHIKLNYTKTVTLPIIQKYIMDLREYKFMVSKFNTATKF